MDNTESWPSVYLTDIAEYLNTGNKKEIVHKLQNEYKQEKTYRFEKL